MKYLSLCSGIEAATVAWHPLGWEAVAYSEIERFPSEVLAHHYPNTPNLGDMTKFKEWTNVSDVDLLVGGTPCQSFSVAGLRKGLDDPRGNLMLTYLAIADKYRPRWLVWENVPGVLSSNGGKDFGVFLGALGELGYGFAYRVLDAQYFGVAQRRRRVFVVGYLGDWRRAAAVLFERHSLSGNPAPSRKKREYPAKCLTRGAGQRYDFETEDLITQPIAFDAYNQTTSDTVTALRCAAGGVFDNTVAQPIPLNSMNCFRSPDADASTGCGIGEEGEAMFTITKMHSHAVAQPQPTIVHGTQDPCVSDIAFAQGRNNGGENVLVQPVATHDVAGTMLSRNSSGGFSNSIDHASAGYMALQSMAVRRLTPKECERLQGFPDNYTDIKSKNKPTPDGPRYKALGNSMAVPVMAWIGKRINEVEQLCKPNK